MTKKELAKKLGVSRSSLYYKSKQGLKDKKLLPVIKQIMAINPSYGHRRIAISLKINHKRVLRIMKKFDLKPALRHTKSKYNRIKKPKEESNLIKYICPIAPNVVWLSDFTYLRFKNKFVFLATVIDVFSRKVIGWHLSLKQDSKMVQIALMEAFKEGVPEIFHRDRGSQYQDKALEDLLKSKLIKVSKNDKSSPWQNSWQESFFSQFKLDLNGTGRFHDYDELVDGIYQQIEYYNNKRIHTALKKSPQEFLLEYNCSLQRVGIVSKKMGT
jgi:putative transposase